MSLPMPESSSSSYTPLLFMSSHTRDPTENCCTKPMSKVKSYNTIKVKITMNTGLKIKNTSCPGGGA